MDRSIPKGKSHYVGNAKTAVVRGLGRTVMPTLKAARSIPRAAGEIIGFVNVQWNRGRIDEIVWAEQTVENAMVGNRFADHQRVR